MIRRSLLAAAILAAGFGGPAFAEQSEVLRASGAVTAKTYPGFAQFVENAADTVVGLKITVAAGDGLVAERGGDGLFVAYLEGSSRTGGTQISARDGVVFQNGAYVLNGFFVPKYAGMGQGITAYVLEKQDDASILLSKTPVKDVDVDKLDPAVKKAD
ncbi:hypothetical protein [Mangrovicella endophytica]|uniref:hypothetical protein n=1 Tax=Mangrovicella endophytica TaxID=2066697 RepID=UPI000C9EAAD4|nr:hypothetical protein [Mangrovicella endophytica]